MGRPPAEVASRPPLRSTGRLRKADVSRCALGARWRTARCSPFWPLPVPGAGGPASRAGNRMEKPARAGAGMQDAGVGCASPRGCVPAPGAFHFISSAGGRPRFLAHPVPSLGNGVESLHRPPLCWTRRCLALPCARLAPPPALSAGYFYPLLAGRCFWGDSGEATPNPLSSPCAPRSGPLLAGSGSKKWTRNWGWSIPAPPPGVSSRNPGTIGSAALLCAPHARGAGTRRSPFLGWLLWLQPKRIHDPLGPNSCVRALQPKLTLFY